MVSSTVGYENLFSSLEPMSAVATLIFYTAELFINCHIRSILTGISVNDDTA